MQQQQPPPQTSPLSPLTALNATNDEVGVSVGMMKTMETTTTEKRPIELNILRGGMMRTSPCLIVMIIVEVQGDDLRRFDKHKRRATLGTMGEYSPVMNCTLFAVHKAMLFRCVIWLSGSTQGIEVWIGKHPLPSYAVH